MNSLVLILVSLKFYIILKNSYPCFFQGLSCPVGELDGFGLPIGSISFSHAKAHFLVFLRTCDWSHFFYFLEIAVKFELLIWSKKGINFSLWSYLVTNLFDGQMI